jgi:hypothetical protein
MTHGIYLVMPNFKLAIVLASALQTRLGSAKRFRIGKQAGLWYVAI